MISKKVCIIPIRSKSKGIVNKNIKKINGIPLICFTLNACIESKIFHKIIIATDSKKYINYIKNLSKKKNKFEFYLRSKKSASDTSPSEFVLEEVIKKKKLIDDLCFFIQATSPLLDRQDIINSYENYLKDKSDSLFTSFLTKKFMWKKFKTKFSSLNYDFRKRKMRQKFEFNYIENGALYIFKAKNLIITKNRLHNRISTYTMPKNRSLEIDNTEDINEMKIFLNKNKKYKKNISKNFRIT